jgi:hypothetical protein
MSGSVYPVEQTFALPPVGGASRDVPPAFRYKSAVRILLSAAVLLSVLALAGCSNDGDDEQAAIWAGPPDPAADGTLAVAGFNEYAEGVDEPWERSPAMAAAEFIRLDEKQASHTTIAGTASPEGTGPETVVVTLDGLQDDSVRAERWVLKFAPDGDVYELTAAEWAQRCQPGRGHQSFTPEPCI